jgi:hypothetical protein
MRRFRQYYRPIVSHPRFWCDARLQTMTAPLNAQTAEGDHADEEASTSALRQVLISFSEAY